MARKYKVQKVDALMREALMRYRCSLRARFLFYAGEAGERAQRAITKMPRSAPIKTVSRQPLAVSPTAVSSLTV